MLITEFGRRWDGGALPRRQRCERPKHWLAALHEEPVLPDDVVAEFRAGHRVRRARRS